MSKSFQVRRNTVVEEGEVLIIRKLVVAGIVAAEKSYIECLNALKEVSYLVKCMYVGMHHSDICIIVVSIPLFFGAIVQVPIMLLTCRVCW